MTTLQLTRGRRSAAGTAQFLAAAAFSDWFVL